MRTKSKSTPESVRPQPLLYENFKKWAEVLLAWYEQPREQSSSNIGFNRELLFTEFLNKVLPPRLVLRRGEIWDGSRNKTGQFEVIILRDDAASLGVGYADVFPVEGVFAVIEVKSKLDTDKLRQGLKQLERVQHLKLARAVRPGRVTSLSQLHTPVRPLLCAFGYKGSALERLQAGIMNSEYRDVPDLVCVVDQGAIINKRLGLVSCEGNGPYCVSPGKAASLAWLYFYLVTLSANFIARDFPLNQYFEPFDGWADH
jgi:hypothetical protein